MVAPTDPVRTGVDTVRYERNIGPARTGSEKKTIDASK